MNTLNMNLNSKSKVKWLSHGTFVYKHPNYQLSFSLCFKFFYVGFLMLYKSPFIKTLIAWILCTFRDCFFRGLKTCLGPRLAHCYYTEVIGHNFLATWYLRPSTLAYGQADYKGIYPNTLPQNPKFHSFCKWMSYLIIFFLFFFL